MSLGWLLKDMGSLMLKAWEPLAHMLHSSGIDAGNCVSLTIGHFSQDRTPWVYDHAVAVGGSFSTMMTPLARSDDIALVFDGSGP